MSLLTSICFQIWRMNETVNFILSSYKILFNRKEDKDKNAFLVPHFEKETLSELIKEAMNQFRKEKVLMEVNEDVLVVGDIHGNLPDLIQIFDHFLLPPLQRYVFLGDYVDRGNFSLNSLILLLALKCKYPHHIWMIRGNHETKSVNSKYGFMEEIENTYKSIELWEEFNNLFDNLPLAIIVKNKYFCVHGGLSPLFTSLDQLTELSLPISNISPLIEDLLWSDPVDECFAYTDSTRGRGCHFGLIATLNFLSMTKLKAIIRGHECVYNGISRKQDNHCVTVFSSSYYMSTGNKCGVLSLHTDEMTEIHFAPRPQLKREEAYFFEAKAQQSSIEKKFIHPPKLLSFPQAVAAHRRLSINAVNLHTRNLSMINSPVKIPTQHPEHLKNTQSLASGRRFSVLRLQKFPTVSSSIL